MSEFPYYYGQESEQFNFYQLPKALLKEKQYAHISTDAKILYCVLRERMMLSRKNGWVDDENRVFIIYPVDEVAKEFGCSKRKAIDLMAELDTNKGIGLIEKHRQGQGKHNIIYVKNFITDKKPEAKAETDPDSDNKQAEGNDVEPAEIKKSLGKPVSNGESESKTTGKVGSFQKCRIVHLKKCRTLHLKKCKTAHLKKCKNVHLKKCRIVHPNNTKYINTKSNNTNLSINQVLDILKVNVEYDILLRDYGPEIDKIDDLLAIMAESYCSHKERLLVNGELISTEVVKAQMMKVNRMHIQYVVSALSETQGQIRNIKAYMLTCLYNAPNTLRWFQQVKSANKTGSAPVNTEGNKSPNKFHNFEEREYDYQEMERLLIDN